MSNKILVLFAIVVLVSGLVAGGAWLSYSGPSVFQHESLPSGVGGSGGCC